MVSAIITRWIDSILARPIRHILETPKRVLGSHVRKGMTVLDVGCGSGRYSLGMAKLVGPEGRVVAVDSKAEAVSALRKQAARKGLSDRIEVRICCKEDLEIDDLAGLVDFALAVYMVHHVPDAARLMSDVHESLKPNGTFLVVEPRHHASPPECETLEEAAKEAGFIFADHPKLKRDWAVRFSKRESADRD